MSVNDKIYRAWLSSSDIIERRAVVTRPTTTVTKAMEEECEASARTKLTAPLNAKVLPVAKHLRNFPFVHYMFLQGRIKDGDGKGVGKVLVRCDFNNKMTRVAIDEGAPAILACSGGN